MRGAHVQDCEYVSSYLNLGAQPLRDRVLGYHAGAVDPIPDKARTSRL